MNTDAAGEVLDVVTDLDSQLPADRQLVPLIVDGINSSGATFVARIRVIHADGRIAEAVCTGVDRYAPE